MMSIALPNEVQYLLPTIQEIIRRCVDFSQNPAQVPVDIKITLSGNGIIFTAASGNTWRMNIVEQTNDDGSVLAVPVLNRVS